MSRLPYDTGLEDMAGDMAHVYERIVSLITRNPTDREDRVVQLLTPWFKDISELFKSQGTDVIHDIIRNCEFRSVPEDTMIIQQGERGECFYIILNGLVSVYINQTLEDEGNIHHHRSSSLGAPSRQRETITRSSTRSRRHQSSTLFPPAGKDDMHNTEKQTVDQDHIDTDKDNTGGAPDTPDQATIVEQPLDCQRQKSRGSTTRCCSSSISADDDTDHGDDNNHDNDDSDSIPERDADKCDVESYMVYSDDESYIEIIQDLDTDRKLLGSHIRQLDAGQSFGELALVQTNLRRNASVVADQQTDLIVVNRDLYNRSLKASQQQEFREKYDFVNSLPLFKTLTPRLKNVMAMSLTPLQFQYGNTLVKQGDPFRRMIFLLSGHAKISMDPIHHIRQYTCMCTDEEMQFAKDISCGRKSRMSWPGQPKQPEVRGMPMTARRRGSYADNEREHNRKQLHICVVGPYEYIGDTEVLLKLPTYTSTVICMETVKAFELNLTNFERIVTRRSNNTLAMMRKMAETKLRSRVSRLAEEQVYCAVVQRFVNMLEEQNTPSPVKAARRKEEEEATALVLQVPSWYNYRDKQRQYLRKRQQERQQRQDQAERMANASRLMNAPIKARNTGARRAVLSVDDYYDHPTISVGSEMYDSDIMLYMKRLSTNVTVGLKSSYRPTGDDDMQISGPFSRKPKRCSCGQSLTTTIAD